MAHGDKVTRGDGADAVHELPHRECVLTVFLKNLAFVEHRVEDFAVVRLVGNHEEEV